MRSAFGFFAPWQPLAAVSAILAVLPSCASNPDDFAVKGRHRQTVVLEEATLVVVRCYCPRRSSSTGSNNGTLTLKVEGSFSSTGYHGRQDKPSSMSPGMLAFATARQDGVVTLTSHEYVYIHHANLLSNIRVEAPEGVIVRFEPLQWQQLQARSP